MDLRSFLIHIPAQNRVSSEVRSRYSRLYIIWYWKPLGWRWHNLSRKNYRSELPLCIFSINPLSSSQWFHRNTVLFPGSDAFTEFPSSHLGNDAVPWNGWDSLSGSKKKKANTLVGGSVAASGVMDLKEVIIFYKWTEAWSIGINKVKKTLFWRDAHE